MAEPTTREEFKNYCLRQLGYPVIDINVDDQQVEDRIDDAIAFYRDYHYDGVEHSYHKHVITADDKTNGYFDLDDSIIGVIRVFDIGDTMNISNLFSIRYQIHLNDLFDFQSSTFTPYVTAMRHIAEIEEIFVGHQPIRFNRHTNRLYVDFDWDKVNAGEYIIVDCYNIVDASTYADVWKDWWLRRYAVALIKRQWGNNMKKFDGMQLPGGATFSGQQIYTEAQDEINRMEEEMILNYSIPASDMIG